MGFPKSVYFDTNTFRNLKKDITTPEYQELQNMCEKLRVTIAIPEIVKEEWLDYYLNQRLVKLFDKLASAIEELNYLIIDKQDLNLKINENSISSNLKTHLEDQLKKTGLLIIETPNMKLSDLVSRAVKKIRPFCSEDKGFRDTMILFTILNHAKKYPKNDHFLISKDGDFSNDDVKKAAKEYGVNLIIHRSIQETIHYLGKFLEDKVKAILEQRSKKLEDFLKEKKEDIISFIRERGAFSELFFTEDLKKAAFTTKYLKLIKSIELLDIYNSRAGFLPKGQDQGLINISFEVKIKFLVLVDTHLYGWPPTFSIGQEIESENIWQSGIEKRKEDEEIIKDLHISGQVYIDSDKNFSKLEIGLPIGF